MTTEAAQTVNSTDAREASTPDARQASMSRVTTQETILANLASTGAASEPANGEQPRAEPGKEEGEAKPKKTPQERIQDLANRRREAEAKAEAAERRAQELEAQVRVLSAKAAPIGEEARPVRSAFTDDEAYAEAVGRWSARRAIAEKERADEKARADAEQAEIASTWSKRQDATMKRLPDYADVVGKSEISVNAFVSQALLESEMGPEITYFLALNPDEAKRLNAMKPIALIRAITKLESDLAEMDDEPPPAKGKDDPAKPQKSKAPEPITPPKSVPASQGSSANSYEEYKRRRQAGKTS